MENIDSFHIGFRRYIEIDDDEKKYIDENIQNPSIDWDKSIDKDQNTVYTSENFSSPIQFSVFHIGWYSDSDWNWCLEIRFQDEKWEKMAPSFRIDGFQDPETAMTLAEIIVQGKLPEGSQKVVGNVKFR